MTGPRGGKSEISRRLSSFVKVKQSNQKDEKQQEKPPYFEYLLTKFTQPEEIFGPWSLKQLQVNSMEYE